MYIYNDGLNTLAHRQRGLEVAMALVRQAHRYKLMLGSVEESCDLVETLLAEGPEAPKCQQYLNVEPQLAGT